MILRGKGRPDGGYGRTPDGRRRIPGVTTILGSWGDPNGLMRWYGKLGIDAAEAEAARTAHVGHAVHDAIELELHGQDHSDPLLAIEDHASRDQAWKAFEAWTRWRDELGGDLTFLATEVAMSDVATDTPFGGTVDAIARAANGELLVIDWKTSKRLYPKHLTQCAAYADLWEARPEHDGEPIRGARIVRVDRETGDYEQCFPPDAVWEAARVQWRVLLGAFYRERSIVQATGLGQRRRGAA
mgnify:CR=1 FL=1